MCARYPLRTIRSHRAFTLVEVIAATAILAGASLTLVWAISSGQAHALNARERLESSLVVEQVLSELVIQTDYLFLGTTFVPTSAGICEIDVGSITTRAITGLPVSVQGRQVHMQMVAEDGRILAELDYFYHDPG